MSTAHVPQQPQDPGTAPPPGLPSTPPHASEATRLLCAGTYLDAGYRDRVIRQLYLNRERVVAPSLGFDAARVLAHAVRARRQELLWSAAIVGLWIVGMALSGGLLFLFLWGTVLLAVAPRIARLGVLPPHTRRLTVFVVLWAGRLLSGYALLMLLSAALFGLGSDESADYGGYDSYDSYDSYDFSDDGPSLMPSGTGADQWQGWLGIAVLVAIGVCVAAQRNQFARALNAELSPQRFPDAAGDPAEQAHGPSLHDVMRRIRLEQHAPLVMYSEARPFCGAGAAYDTWVLAVELRPDRLKKQQPLSNRVILEQVRPLLQQLKVPSEYAGPGVRDRLRTLEIDECVFLPADGLHSREDAPYTYEDFEGHRARSVEEGGEKRRHFLRIRVGGWEEELVVTVFVRVHTQGGMLMLEIAPHVLTPVLQEFKDADRTAHRLRTSNPFGKAATAAVLVPGSIGRALICLGRGTVYAWRLMAAGWSRELPDGPELSVRELGSVPEGSTFQEMDVTRYLRSVQDRVVHGVRTALSEAGYETGDFVQKVINITNGNLNIGQGSNSSFNFGSGSAQTHNTHAGRDRATEELFAAVREFRADLERLQQSEQRDELVAALADTEDEIGRTGAAGEGRLARLRAALTDANSLASLFASGAALAGLLGS